LCLHICHCGLEKVEWTKLCTIQFRNVVILVLISSYLRPPSTFQNSFSFYIIFIIEQIDHIISYHMELQMSFSQIFFVLHLWKHLADLFICFANLKHGFFLFSFKCLLNFTFTGPWMCYFWGWDLGSPGQALISCLVPWGLFPNKCPCLNILFRLKLYLLATWT
jgi:hypothetical protein